MFILEYNTDYQHSYISIYEFIISYFIYFILYSKYEMKTFQYLIFHLSNKTTLLQKSKANRLIASD